MYVRNLMVDGERKWDATKIDEFFSSDMAEPIMSVPLFPMIEHDKLMWDGDKNGVYTVRSGYKLIMSNLLRSESNYVEGVNGQSCGVFKHHQRLVIWHGECAGTAFRRVRGCCSVTLIVHHTVLGVMRMLKIQDKRAKKHVSLLEEH
ncbi:hypothetical protein L195_g031140 [Trifolium pratense]|uniref:Uncharacterized protein n=1 Tax=Trifolium pratense TaxID=57577 RepID=A0A2K3L9J6_TRIPR|nr:hypothetical protein L195_g031140 [Trifolium pratense]